MTDFIDHVKFAQHNLLSLLFKSPISPLFCGSNAQSQLRADRSEKQLIWLQKIWLSESGVYRLLVLAEKSPLGASLFFLETLKCSEFVFKNCVLLVVFCLSGYFSWLLRRVVMDLHLITLSRRHVTVCLLIPHRGPCAGLPFFCLSCAVKVCVAVFTWR